MTWTAVAETIKLWSAGRDRVVTLCLHARVHTHIFEQDLKSNSDGYSKILSFESIECVCIYMRERERGVEINIIKN